MIKTFASIGSLKARITVVVVFLVLLAAGLVTYVSLHLAERQMRSVVGDQQFALLSSAAAYIDEDLVSKKSLLAALREQLVYADIGAPSAIQGFLEAHGSLRDEFFNVIALDKSGKLIANLNDRRAVGDFSKRDYFIDTVAAHEGLVSHPFRSTLSGKPVVVVTEPVYDAAGKLLFVIGGAIDLQRPRFFGQLEALKSGRTGYLFMLTTTGTIIHHPDKQRILNNVKDEAGGVVPSTLAAMNGFEGTLDGKSKRGIVSLITYKRLRQTDWIIGAVYPVDEAFAPLIDMRKNAMVASAAVAAAAGLIGWLAILRLLRPLGALRKHVARIAEGSKDIDVFDVARKDEFGELSRAFFNLSQQRRDAENNLVKLTRTDPLTDIHNRRMFDEIFAAALERARRSRRGLGLAYLDIDRFKQINDTYGHGVGDQVLVEFAKRLKNCVRITDAVARLAGDEFVVIFEHLGSHDEAAGLATKMLDAIRPDFLVGGLVLTVTSSVGIAVDMGSVGAVGDFMEEADKALYAAKEAGRNGYSVRLLRTPSAQPAGVMSAPAVADSHK
ncbi:sensor domain-containing diguanylate cyclase [Massilia eurypsychrophila]|jgi:diguanylate cyclase (GGDEF)-like protein|uniref:Sensor domain-containing diguanylate cyclase n=1 Tax=Massilia eurypsychrophila TaxID=1485217 RepID=A0A2G8TJU8_9BURK|nr:diguanylate cyclase [Massilia eurypsychrophila]PIL46229.1 sensor domain-containing diguanylate cyclase [Massilia eurypsychrophila]